MVKEDLSDAFLALIKSKVKPESLVWLQTQGEKVRAGLSASQLSMIFAQVPRYSSKLPVGPFSDHESLRGEYIIQYEDWTIESVCRVWILLQLPADDKASYLKNIDMLFNAAEMNELVALYKALPLLEYPESWISRCEEGIRSNIGPVLEAIMYHNTYPAEWLSEAAWNQMILKAFFTEKDVRKIDGLEERMNPSLISTLEDYVKERQAAGRTVNPELDKLINITE